jgi:hypothetical protein
MTTWTEVSDQTTSYTEPSDEENNYVVSGYMVNGYLDGARVWGAVDNASTDWVPA